MSTIEPPCRISMVRNDLKALPELALPDGYRIRAYQEGDDITWKSLLHQAFGDVVLERSFEKDIQGRDGYDPNHVYFIETQHGAICATASGVNGYNASQGYVHWVAVSPDHGGQGLGYWISLQVLHGFIEAGKTHAFLDTEVFRIPAIKTYLRLGFRPYISEPYQLEHWQDVGEEITYDTYWEPPEGT